MGARANSEYMALSAAHGLVDMPPLRADESAAKRATRMGSTMAGLEVKPVLNDATRRPSSHAAAASAAATAAATFVCTPNLQPELSLQRTCTGAGTQHATTCAPHNPQLQHQQWEQQQRVAQQQQWQQQPQQAQQSLPQVLPPSPQQQL